MADALAAVHASIEEGIECIRHGDRDAAIARLDAALPSLDGVPDQGTRRDKYALLATLFIQLQAGDRALEAARAATGIDEALGERNLLGQDILLCGTAMGTMGNHKAAEDAYRDARRIFLDDKNWANAASATTNMAIVVGQRDIDQAIDLLEESLVYLGRQGFPDTEITTRIALVQALVVAERPPERVFEVAGELFRRFWGDLRPDQRENSVGPLEAAIGRYLDAHPVPDAAAWKADRFPQAYG